MDKKYMQRKKKAKEIIPLTSGGNKGTRNSNQGIKGMSFYNLGRAMEMNNWKSIVNALFHNLDFPFS